MKAKFFVFTLMAAIVLAGIVSASFTATLDGSFTKADDTVILKVTSDAADTINISPIVDITDGTNSLSVSANKTNLVFTGAGSQDVELTYAGDTTAFALGTFPTSVQLSGTSSSKNVTLNFISSFCDTGVKGKYEPTIGEKYELTMNIDNIDVTGFGPEDTEWYPLDDVEIKLDLDNKGNEDIKDIMIEVCLYNEDEDKCVVDEDDMNVDDDFKIKDGDDYTAVITYQVSPDDIDEAGSYILYIKSFSDDLEEENLCIEDSEAITIVEDEFLLLSNVVIPESVPCGETVPITADVWNIDSDEQNDVSVRVTNKELGINEVISVGDIDSWDKNEISFSIAIPNDAQEKSYTLKFEVLDEDNDIYETDKDEEKSDYTYSLVVEGNCAGETVAKNAQITASLETEDVTAGQEVRIKATVKNTGEEETSYSIGVDGYEFFSTVQSITPSTLTLDAGQSGDVFITLKLNDDASGENIFNIKALFDSEEVRQPVSLTVASGGVSITGSAIGASIRENWFIWLIVIINIILIVAIIIVAARMSKA